MLVKNKSLKYVLKLHSRKLSQHLENFELLCEPRIIPSPQVVKTLPPKPLYDAKEVYDEAVIQAV